MSGPPSGMREQAHASGVRTWHFTIDGPAVLAAITTRHGGCSSGPFTGLNLGFHVGDDPDAVATNRALVCDALRVAQLTVADQQHGRRVAVIDSTLGGAGHGSLADSQARLGSIDALVTDVVGVALAVMVADCAPVVLHDPERGAIGVAHVGRNGAVLDVVAATVESMTERYGSRPGDLRAGVGPCVAPSHYEIGGAALDEVRAALGADFLVPTRPGHARFDLVGAVRRRLLDAGVDPARTELSAADTFGRGTDLFSDRAERPCGRFMLVASLRP